MAAVDGVRGVTATGDGGQLELLTGQGIKRGSLRHDAIVPGPRREPHRKPDIMVGAISALETGRLMPTVGPRRADQFEWQIEWQTALAGAHPTLVGAGLGWCSPCSGSVTRRDGTARLFMVRRKSTVRFRKGDGHVWGAQVRAGSRSPASAWRS